VLYPKLQKYTSRAVKMFNQIFTSFMRCVVIEIVASQNSDSIGDIRKNFSIELCKMLRTLDSVCDLLKDRK